MYVQKPVFSNFQQIIVFNENSFLLVIDIEVTTFWN